MHNDLLDLRLEELLLEARALGASDVHLTAGNAPFLRVDGQLQKYGEASMTAEDVAAIARSWLGESRFLQVDRGLDVSVALAQRAGTLRVHAYRTCAGIAVSIRLLAWTVPSLESLALPASVELLAQRRAGLVLVGGATGSGKTTVLAALVHRIVQVSARHVVTIEDPIEYLHQPGRGLVTQREVGRDAASFSDAVLNTLRADPDVIVIGEMRDRRTIAAALTAAETGHLVFATLHTVDAMQCVDRIVGVFPGEEQEQVRLQLSQTLAGVLCLRLVQCAATSGRRCAAEILIATDAVRHVIRENKTHHLRNLVASGRQFGMQTMEAHLSDLVARGEVLAEDARGVTDHADDLAVTAFA